MTWQVFASGSEGDPKDLLDKLVLVEIYDGSKNRALAYAFAALYVPASSIGGIPQSAKVRALVRSYVPLTKGAAVPPTELIDVYSGQPLAVLPKDAKMRLRYIDQRGVPWWIEGLVIDPSTARFVPAEGFDKPAIAWTSHYYGDEGVAVEADTLDDLKARIRSIQAEQPRNPTPTFDQSTGLQDDEGPLFVKDPAGDFRLHGVDRDGKYQIWAARQSLFQNDVVGPASSLAQIRADVAAYRRDLASAPTLGLAALGLAPEPSTARFSLAEEEAITSPEAAVASQEAASAARWRAGLGWALVGLAIYAGYQWDKSRGL